MIHLGMFAFLIILIQAIESKVLSLSNYNLFRFLDHAS